MGVLAIRDIKSPYFDFCDEFSEDKLICCFVGNKVDELKHVKKFCGIRVT